MKPKLTLILFASLSLFAIPAQACYESQIMKPTPFMGNNDEIFVLADGSIWQVKYEYEYLYEYYPQVTICPQRNLLIVDGKRLNVENISGGASGGDAGTVIESRVDGDWEGWQGDTIVKLTNGQIWEQIGAKVSARARVNPKVLIFKRGSGHFMQVDGESSAVQVGRLR
jgi:hypothetical protein